VHQQIEAYYSKNYNKWLTSFTFAFQKNPSFWGLSNFNPHLSRSDWDGDIIPHDTTASQTDMNIVKVMLWIKKNGYEESTVDKRSTERYISLFDEQNIIWIPVICHNQAETEQAIKDDCELVC
jgi:hypothetical protein